MSKGYTAIVLAGDRGPDDPVARATGAPCKALSPVAGVPLLFRVLDSLGQLPRIQRILVVGPQQSIVAAYPQLEAALSGAHIDWIAPADTPSVSASRALARLHADCPVLLTTADHPLLVPAMIEPLLTDSAGADLSVGLAAYARVRAAYPHSRRTAIRLGRTGGYCGCNLFAVHTSAGRRLIAEWQRVERQRKHPAAIVAGLLGWSGLLRYALGRLELDAAFARLSRRMAVRVRPVLIDQPEAAVDVDSVADLALVESILAARSRAVAACAATGDT